MVYPCKGGGGQEGSANGWKVSFRSEENVLRLVVVMAYNSVNTRNTIKLFTLNRRIVWYVKYISVKLPKMVLETLTAI